MLFTLHYYPAIRVEDLPLIDRKTKDRIRKAIEERLQTAPHDYGEPLRKSLKGYWKLRVGDYRVVFKVIETEVWILGIRHRKSVYVVNKPDTMTQELCGKGGTSECASESSQTTKKAARVGRPPFFH
ncbi:MAG: type II toxin-antitoxin system RelE/ParE family toxin [Syntrophus sp. (in: bacteria)]